MVAAAARTEKLSQFEALQRRQGTVSPVKMFKMEQGKKGSFICPRFEYKHEELCSAKLNFVSSLKLSEVFHTAEQNRVV